MLKQQLEHRLSKGTRNGEGTRSSIRRFRLNEILYDLKNDGALVVDNGIHVALDRVSPVRKDKIRTVLLSEKARCTEVSPFADLPFGIRRVHREEGPLHAEVTGDRYDKVPWVLTVAILEASCGWSYEGMEKIGYLPTPKGPKRMKDVGLFYEGGKPTAAMYYLEPPNDYGRILVRWLNGRRQILVRYNMARSSHAANRLGYRYFIDYTMFSSSRVKRKAVEFLAPLEKEFNDRYEPTLAETKKALVNSRNE